jgi:hypothetical protein
MKVQRLVVGLVLSLASAPALASCSPVANPSPTGAGSASTSPDSAPVSVKGNAYIFSFPPGWTGSPSDGPWPVERIPEDGAPGVAFLFDTEGGEDWIAIGERAVPAGTTLKSWSTGLQAVHTTDYQKLCGKTHVEMDSVRVDGKPANIATFKCPNYGSVDAVVSTVSSGYGLLMTCHSVKRTIPVQRRECQRLLDEGFQFNG